MAALKVIEQKCLKASNAFALLALGLALTSLTGWVFSLPILYRFSLSFPAMTIETILGISLAVATVLMINRTVRLTEKQFIFANRFSRFTAFALILMGLATILFYLFYSVDFIYQGVPVPEELSSPRTSLAFICLGLGIYCGIAGRNYGIAGLVFLSFPFYLAVISLTGYVLSMTTFYSLIDGVGMSIPTSLSFISIVFAAIFGPLRLVGRGFLLAPGAGGAVARRLLPLVLLFPPICTWLVWMGYLLDIYSQSLAIVLLAVLPCAVFSLAVGLLSARLSRSERKVRREQVTRKSLEAEFALYRNLESSRAHFEALVLSSADAIISQSKQGKITFWNNSAVALFGYSAEEAMDCGFLDLLKEEDKENFNREVKLVEKGKLIREFKACGLRHDRSPVDLSLTLSPIYDDREIDEISIVARDITEQEAQLKAHKEISEKLEKANVAKDEFLSVLSHELRTPLNIILGYLELLPELEAGTEEYNKAIEIIKSNALIEADLVEDTLHTSQIVAGEFKLKLEAFDLNELLHEVIDSNELAIEAKGLSFEKNIDPSVGMFLGDPRRVRQVVWNLLSNAIKFTKRGVIRVEAQRKASDYVITVSDTGIGIPKDKLDSIFQRFWQVDSGTKRRFGGMGIGLSLAQQLAESHGGSLTAQSEGAGKGTTMRACFPLKASKEASYEAKRNAFEVIEGGTKALLDQQTVLVVEDNPDSRNLLEDLLKRMGANTLSAENGIEALKLFKENVPSLILCDLGMPIMDGFEFARELKLYLNESNLKTHLVAVTAFASPADRRAAFRLGFEAYLTKPLKLSELREVIEDLLSDDSRSEPLNTPEQTS